MSEASPTASPSGIVRWVLPATLLVAAVTACSAGGDDGAGITPPGAGATGSGGVATGGTGTGGGTAASGGVAIGVGGVTGSGGSNDASRLDKPSPSWSQDFDAGRRVPAGQEAAAAEFTGTLTGAALPRVTYPLAGSVHPWNIGKIGVQWEADGATAATTKFRVFVSDEATIAYEYYVSCGQPPWGGDPGQCYAELPREEWRALAFEQAGKTFKMAVQATTGAGAPIESGAPVEITFSPEALEGALYYWAAAAATTAGGTDNQIKRASLGSDEAVTFQTAGEFQCVSCHSVARDGTTVAFALGGENSSASSNGIQVAPATSPDSPTLGVTGSGSSVSNYQGHNVALSPDGKYAAVNGVPTAEEAAADGVSEGWPPYLEIRDTATGNRIARYYMSLDAANGGLFGYDSLPIFPEWSPDGTKIAAALASKSDYAEGACVWTSETCFSSIVVMDVQSEGGVPTGLGAPRTIVAAEELGGGNLRYRYHYYPSWSPDGKYLAFASSVHDLDRVGLDGATDEEFDDNGPTGNKRPKAQKANSNPYSVLYLVDAEATTPQACPGDGCWELTNCTGYDWNAVNGDAVVANNGSGSPVTPDQARMSTWPKIAPFQQPFGDSNLIYVTFNSRRKYGSLEPRTIPTTFGQGASQLWMCAVDLGALAPGADPSRAPLYLPQQQYTDGSLTPYWTEALPCEIDAAGTSCTGCLTGESCIVIDAERNKCDCVVNTIQ